LDFGPASEQSAATPTASEVTRLTADRPRAIRRGHN
jgi:hypothetical protein